MPVGYSAAMTAPDKTLSAHPSTDAPSKNEEAARKIRQDLEAMLNKTASKSQKLAEPAAPGQAADPQADAGKA